MSQGGVSRVAATAAARAIHEGWLSDLELLRSRGADADWIAYSTGGIDALDECLGA